MGVEYVGRGCGGPQSGKQQSGAVAPVGTRAPGSPGYMLLSLPVKFSLAATECVFGARAVRTALLIVVDKLRFVWRSTPRRRLLRIQYKLFAEKSMLPSMRIEEYRLLKNVFGRKDLCFNRKRIIILSELNKNPVEGFSAGLIDDNDIYRWEVLIIGPPDTLYEGGFFKAHLHFPKEYPLRPPRMKFITEIWHPNSQKECSGSLDDPIVFLLL
ncbi:hypothetical protein C0J52_10301 [Blattella germanica]|nr:hypothetical protein C0J52_10301 [Blattella germanica]